MSIKNPLTGHQYGRSEPGYWYPRDDTPNRGRPLGAPKQRLSVLVLILILAVIGLIGVGRAKHVTVTLTFAPFHIRVSHQSSGSANPTAQPFAPADPIISPPAATSVANRSCQTDFKQVETAVEVYRAEMGAWPTSLAALETTTASSGAPRLIRGPWVILAPDPAYRITVQGSPAGGAAVTVAATAAPPRERHLDLGHGRLRLHPLDP
jgi:hypothetical protein